MVAISLSLPKLPWVHSLHPVEKTGEGGALSEMETVGNLGDAERGLAQEEYGLHEQQLVDVVDDGAATRYLTNDAREVGGGDAEFGCIETNVVMLDEVLGQ